ncbi:hypothetical protein BS78_01G070500 [Paspalum vaginatum]|nr:hypothetical protein BS78_01G070500 [Paspalum vaginatum]
MRSSRSATTSWPRSVPPPPRTGLTPAPSPHPAPGLDTGLPTTATSATATAAPAPAPVGRTSTAATAATTTSPSRTCRSGSTRGRRCRARPASTSTSSGTGDEERSACVQPELVLPNPSTADHARTAGHRDGGNGGAAANAAVSQPKRKVQAAGRDGEDLGRPKKKARASDNKQEKKAAPKTAQRCGHESAQRSRGSCSGDESNCSEVNHPSGAHGGCGGNGKARAAKGSAIDPQSLYARRRRERINERLKILQKLVPNGTKVDISTMLEEAVHYVRFLQQQIKMLSSDEMWMYAPIAYNGMSLGIDLKLSPQ